MTDISQFTDFDQTLYKMSDEIIKAQEGRKRNYLGMSEIGEACWRMLWFRFRNVLKETLSLKSLLAIEDGYKQEAIMADRLRLVPGLKLDTVDPENGEQFGVKLFGGHFCGHCDGKISGILESPKTLHIWENKAVNEKKFKQLKDLIMNIGDKSALANWDEIYYAQAIIYMDEFKLTRHYLTCETPGGRDYTSCRTEANKKEALSIKAKAEAIITAEKPLTRLSENRSFYKCGWCRMKEICFDNKVPCVNCRTCTFSEPDINDKTMSGFWKCYKKNINFVGEGQVCESHLFLNTLVPFKTIDADQSAGTPSWIKYQASTGETFFNINKDAKIKGLTSIEIYEKEFFELAFKSKSDILSNIQKDKETTKKLKGLI